MHLTGPPITIYEEVFADIVEDLARLQNRPENEEVMRHTGEIARDTLGMPDSEDSHEDWMSLHIEHLLGLGYNDMTRPDDVISRRTTGLRCDGVFRGNGAIYLHVECKHELGLGGIADIQAPLTLLKIISGPEACRAPSVRDKLVIDTFLFSILQSATRHVVHVYMYPLRGTTSHSAAPFSLIYTPTNHLPTTSTLVATHS